MMVQIEQSWQEVLRDEFEKPYFKEVVRAVKEAYVRGPVFPRGGQIFRAFDLCPFNQVKVVILGQDPYHGVGQANGLSFSVPKGVALPPSLLNIYKELSGDLGVPRPREGDLESWAQQGVLLLNAVLTVLPNQPASHSQIGWQQFTDRVIDRLSTLREHVVFVLWGAYARRKSVLIDRSKHCILEAAHPSPLSASRGFFGSHPFSKANMYLVSHGILPIDWTRGLL